jgi:2-phosphosulfolactate phosphatase
MYRYCASLRLKTAWCIIGVAAAVCKTYFRAMPTLEVVLTPALFHLRTADLHQKNVVVIDILRATSTICTAFHNGATQIVTTATPAEALRYREQGYLCAAERDGNTVEGFELGNSPQDYTRDHIQGKRIALTTTNGTRCLRMSQGAHRVFAGSFLNIGAMASYLLGDGRPVLLFCAGWKDRFNLEDTLYAGALAARLMSAFTCQCDAGLAAIELWNNHADNPAAFLEKASHAQRFKTLHRESDIEVCLRMDSAPVLPYMVDGVLYMLEPSGSGR